MALDPMSARWWQGVAEGRLLYQRCRNCNAAVFFPRILCNLCHNDSLDWCESRGNGTIYASTTVRRAPAAEFASCLPYVVALVDLDEGFRMMSNVIGLEDCPSIGAPAFLEFKRGLNHQPGATTEMVPLFRMRDSLPGDVEAVGHA